MRKGNLLPSQFYHIYNHAVGNDLLFRNDENYRFFLEKYSYYISQIASTYCYCLMPNHFHFLVRIKEESEVDLELLKANEFSENLASKQFSRFFSSYTQSYNKVNKRFDNLFISNFNRKHVDDDSYFSSFVYYIHANPVLHGFCTDLTNWKYSSYKSILSHKPTLLEREYVIQWFGNEREFIKFHQQEVNLDNIKELIEGD